MASITVGLTGGLASGKSTVARQLDRAGFRVVDADVLVADLYRPEAPGVRIVAQLFGSGFLTAEGAVDKPALAQRIFSDERSRVELEAAVHPLVRARFRQIAATCEGAVVLEAAKLVESGWADEFDLVVTVEAPEATRLKRASRRKLPVQEAERRIAAQGSEALRRSHADVVIDNSGSRADLAAQVDKLAGKIRRLARAAENPGRRR